MAAPSTDARASPVGARKSERFTIQVGAETFLRGNGAWTTVTADARRGHGVGGYDVDTQAQFKY